VDQYDHIGTHRERSGARKPANIYDVAKLANVSIKTVSKVVNNQPVVSSATRARVMKAVEALAYRPNLLARGLASEQFLVIGLLCDAPAAGSGYIARISAGILTMSRKVGYHLIVECLDAHNPNLGDQVRSLVAESRLTGAVLTPPLSDLPNLIDALRDTRTPIARIAAEGPASGVIDVRIDNRKAAYDMAGYLIGLGHKRIGFIKGPVDHADANARFDGYRTAMADAGLPFVEELCVQGQFTYRSGIEAGDRLLALEKRPTAIFASNDDMAAAVMAASLRVNLRIPQDLSVAGFDDSLFAQAVWPRMTTCRQPIAEMAETAVSMLIRQQPESGPRKVCLKHKIIVRGTTAPPSALR
jgi:LacI family transcriptional regulator